RALDGTDVPDVPVGPTGCAARARSRRTEGDPTRLSSAQATAARACAEDRRGVGAISHRGLLVPLAKSRARGVTNAVTIIAIAGASGFLGSALARHLTSSGHQVRRIGRRSSRGADFHWDLNAGTLDPAALDGADAVINFAGATIAQRWTHDHKTAILASR